MDERGSLVIMRKTGEAFNVQLGESDEAMVTVVKVDRRSAIIRIEAPKRYAIRRCAVAPVRDGDAAAMVGRRITT